MLTEHSQRIFQSLFDIGLQFGSGGEINVFSPGSRFLRVVVEYPGVS